MINNLVKLAVNTASGKLYPLLVDSEHKTGLLNPSIYLQDGELLLNVRHVQYVLYHSENNQYFQSLWGPLAYLHPEHDQTLTTINYLGKFDKETKMADVSKVDTSLLDQPPLWEFVGLEDVRLVVWDGITWMCGVRRDTTTNGKGRIEMSKVIEEGGVWKEIERYRLDTPNSADTYCEKNWMPINDKPYHFVKWSNPIEVVKVDLNEKVENGNYKCEQVFLSSKVKNFPRDIRGGSNLVSWGDGYLMLTHEVDLFKSELGRKDAFYYHRFIYLNKDFEVEKFSTDFNFLTGNIEFGTGLVIDGDSVYISFGFQDNSAFLLETSFGFINGLLNIG